MSIKNRLAKLEKQQARPRCVGQFPGITDEQHNRAMDTLAEAVRESITGKMIAAVNGEYAAEPVNLSPLAQEIARRLDAIAEVQHEQANQ